MIEDQLDTIASQGWQIETIYWDEDREIYFCHLRKAHVVWMASAPTIAEAILAACEERGFYTDLQRFAPPEATLERLRSLLGLQRPPPTESNDVTGTNQGLRRLRGTMA